MFGAQSGVFGSQPDILAFLCKDYLFSQRASTDERRNSARILGLRAPSALTMLR